MRVLSVLVLPLLFAGTASAKPTVVEETTSTISALGSDFARCTMRTMSTSSLRLDTSHVDRDEARHRLQQTSSSQTMSSRLTHGSASVDHLDYEQIKRTAGAGRGLMRKSIKTLDGRGDGTLDRQLWKKVSEGKWAQIDGDHVAFRAGKPLGPVRTLRAPK